MLRKHEAQFIPLAFDVAREGLEVDPALPVGCVGLDVDDLDVELVGIDGDLHSLQPILEPRARPRVQEALQVIGKAQAALLRESVQQVVVLLVRRCCERESLMPCTMARNPIRFAVSK